MKLVYSIFVFVCIAAASGCTTSGMTVTTMDKSGRTETKTYTKYYGVGDWVATGQVGIEIWIDHEKEVSPLYSLQVATGTLGPSDLEATGLVTVYVVNLEQRQRQITDLVVSRARGKEGVLQISSSDLAPRAISKIVPGRLPISNYGTEVPLSVQFKLDGVAYSKSLTVKRRTETDEVRPAKDFPWLQAPYFPFDPPLSMPK